MTVTLVGFTPINDDHAVQSVVFTLAFQSPLSAADLEHVRSRHVLWREELPAVTDVPGFEMGFGPDGPSPIKGTRFVNYSYYRPDGTPAWELRFEPMTITVECTRYSRWNRVWAQARRLLLAGLQALSEANDSQRHKLAVLSLHVADRFVGATGSPLGALLISGDYVPAFIFRAGNLWHSHSGWFAHHALGPALNQLNLDATRDHLTDGTLPRVAVSARHIQELRLTEPFGLTEATTLTDQLVDEPMAWLHERNKDLVGSILTEDMIKQIGLNAAEI